MSAILGTSVTGAGAAGAYAVSNSLRFRRDASAFLNRTPASAGNGTTWTWSGWVKRGTLSNVNLNIFGAGWSGSGWLDAIRFTDNFGFQYAVGNTGGFVGQLRTTQLFRDPSAWYHIVCVWDTTQATASERMRLFVNGSRVTALSTANYPSQNQSTTWINQTQVHRIGSEAYLSGGDYYDGQMAEMYFIDGQALNASSFGETNASTGVWQPKAYAGAYGTNGFYLKFSDIATTSGSNAGLGRDFSGNSNFWNTNNISVTPGITYDAMTDSPTPVSSTVGNYAVWNPLKSVSAPTNGNLTVSSPQLGGARATQAFTSGKWYWEVTISSATSFIEIGVVPATLAGSTDIGASGANMSGYYTGGSKILNGSFTAYGASFTTNDVIGVAVNADANTIEFFKNGTSQGSFTMATSAGTEIQPAVGDANNAASVTNTNFGQRPFAYTPPTGFNRLQTFNLPTPTIGASSTTLAGNYFNVGLYTGTGSSSPLAVSGANTPDFVWIKVRSAAYSHSLLDKLRDSADPFSLRLYSNGTQSEYDYGSSLLTPTSTGFNLTTSDPDHNNSGQTYVAWQWKANGAGVTNTAGSLTSTVSANTTSGFSIVTYTGQAADGTVGHGLGVAPKMIIVKNRNAAGNNWVTYHASLGNAAVIYLNLTNAVQNGVGTWNSTTPSSTVFSVDGGDSQVNAGSNNYVAYCFAEVAGYSKFGSYEGNGSTDGPFVYLGFRPKFVMLKNITNAQEWVILDSARAPTNVAGDYLRPNSAGAENSASSPVTSTYQDFLSNGIKLRNNASSSGYTNQSGQTYIYMAFAENPFNYSLAR